MMIMTIGRRRRAEPTPVPRPAPPSSPQVRSRASCPAPYRLIIDVLFASSRISRATEEQRASHHHRQCTTGAARYQYDAPKASLTSAPGRVVVDSRRSRADARHVDDTAIVDDDERVDTSRRSEWLRRFIIIFRRAGKSLAYRASASFDGISRAGSASEQQRHASACRARRRFDNRRAADYAHILIL